MSHRYLLTLLGLILIAFGLFERGAWLLAAWLGVDFLVLGFAHARGFHRMLGKRPDGSFEIWSWLAYLPLLLYTNAVWRLLRVLSHEQPFHHVSKDLTLGRRLLPREVNCEFANYIDLTAEFLEPTALRQSATYLCFPILDGAAPDPKALDQFLDTLRPGKTFIHCAQGHGRTGLVALAFLLKSGQVKTVEEGLEKLRAVRPGIKLSATQTKCIDQFASTVNRGLVAKSV